MTLLCVLLCAAASPLIGQETGTLTGRVLERRTQAPLPGVNILLLDTERGASTGADGRFRISGVPVGTYRVRASFIGFRPHIEPDVVISTAHNRDILFLLDEEAVALGEGVEVTASYFHTPREQTTSIYGINYEEIRRQPGAAGDVSRMIQTMPGVVPTNDQRNDLVVRGGAPSENLTLVDGFEIPNISHFGTQGSSGGPINMISAEFIREANFSAGGFSARYGDRLSSVLDIQLREGSRDGIDGTFDIGFAGAGLLVEGPFNQKGSWMLSARKSYLDLLFDDFGLTAVPNYTNYQAKAVYDVAPAHRLTLISLGGLDDIHFLPDYEDTAEPEVLDIRSNGWRSSTGVNWRWLWEAAGYGTLSVSDNYSTFNQEALDPRLAGTPLIFRNASTEGESILAYDAVLYLKGIAEVMAGVKHRFVRAEFDIFSGTDSGPFVQDSAGIERPDILRDVRTDRSAAYVQAVTSPLPRTDLTLGLRYDRYGFTGEEFVSPRAALRYRLRDNLNLSASAGLFAQQPAMIYLNGHPANRNLLPIQAAHYIAGIAWYPAPDLKLSLEGYVKRYSNYPVSAEFPQLSLANDGDSYTISGRLIPLVSEGEGYARGVEFFVQRKLSNHLYGQISYTYSRARHAALDGVERPGSFDIPHVFYAIGGWRFDEQWEFSAKFSFASGRPRTPMKMPESAEQNRFVLDLTRINTLRMPDYQRLDIRIDNRQHFSGWNLVSYVEVQNVSDRDNVFMYVWNEKTRSEQVVNQIGLFFLGGFKIEF